MYGLEKKTKFEFDLEVEIKKKPKRKEEIIVDAKEKAEEIKKAFQNKSHSEDVEKLGIMLNAYEAIAKVISKI